VNAWNSAQSLTAAWLAVDDWATSDDGAIVVEACLPACRDQEVEPIVRFVELAIAEGSRFWSASARSG
jgi:hypothetical protein